MQVEPGAFKAIVARSSTHESASSGQHVGLGHSVSRAFLHFSWATLLGLESKANLIATNKSASCSASHFLFELSHCIKPRHVQKHRFHLRQAAKLCSESVILLCFISFGWLGNKRHVSEESRPGLRWGSLCFFRVAL